MKIRIGITAPLELENREEARVGLPYLVERNFGVDDGAAHSIWIESRQPLSTTNAALKAELGEQGAYALRGAVRDSDLSGKATEIRVRRSPSASTAWGADPRSGKNGMIVQRLEQQPIAPPSRVVLVIDGSAVMASVRDEIAASLARLPANLDTAVIVAGDEPVELGEANGSKNTAMADKLRALDYVGGRDNVPALARAWDIAAQEPGAAIVWVHGPQPILFHSLEVLHQRWERRPGGPRLYELPVRNGADAITAGLDGVDAVRTLRSADTVGQSLERLFANWDGQSTQWVFVRERAKGEWQSADLRSSKASSHLARLWARDETFRLMAMGSPQRDDAIKIAAAYQIVTPVTGAVVLESAEQYQAAGLEPAPQDQVPTVPEPEEWALMIIVGIALTWMTLRGRRRWNAC
jgi:hypothetical protein